MVGSTQKFKCTFIQVIIVVIILFGTIFSTVDAADVTTVSISPSSLTFSPGASFDVDVSCVPGQPIKSFELKLSFDPSLLKVNSVIEGDIFAEYTTFFNSGIIDNTAGTIVNIYNLIIGAGDVSNAGTFININLTAKETTGVSSLNLFEVGVTDEEGYLSISVIDGSVTIQESEDDPPGDGGSSGGGGGLPPSGESGNDENSTEDQNNPPETPIAPSGSTFVEIGVEYYYSSFTTDVDDDQIRFRFDWDDGSYSDWSEFVSSNSSVSMSHSWSSISSFEIRVMAQDENGMNSSYSSYLEVIVSQYSSGEVPINVKFNYSNNESDDLTIDFDASGSFDIDGNITSYFWIFGDGEDGETETGINPVYVYKNSGTYMVTLIVTDDNGQTYDKTMYITVGSEAQSNVEEESGEKNGISLFYIIGGVIGIVSIVIVFLFVVLRGFPKPFASKQDGHLGRLIKIFDENERIERLDAKIEKLKKMREMTDIEKSSTKMNDYSSETLDDCDMVGRYIDSKLESKSGEERSNLDTMRGKIDKILERSNLDTMRGKIDKILEENKQ